MFLHLSFTDFFFFSGRMKCNSHERRNTISLQGLMSMATDLMNSCFIKKQEHTCSNNEAGDSDIREYFITGKQYHSDYW